MVALRSRQINDRVCRLNAVDKASIFDDKRLWCVNRFDPSGERRADFGEAYEVAAENHLYLIES